MFEKMKALSAPLAWHANFDLPNNVELFKTMKASRIR